jgi:hypothetical protein
MFSGEQMPQEAKKFTKIDKDWAKIMGRALETALVVPCCSNELLRNTLPVLYSELEKCQKSLEGYLEQKRTRFPRFYFVSNPVLLLILSQGSEPTHMQAYYEKVRHGVNSPCSTWVGRSEWSGRSVRDSGTRIWPGLRESIGVQAHGQACQ